MALARLGFWQDNFSHELEVQYDQLVALVLVSNFLVNCGIILKFLRKLKKITLCQWVVVNRFDMCTHLHV